MAIESDQVDQMKYLFLCFLFCLGCQSVPQQSAARIEPPQEVVSALGTAFNIQDTGVKYCPVDGKRYSSRMDLCPGHKVKLLPVE